MGSTRLFIRLIAPVVGVVAIACSGGDGDVVPVPTPTPFPTVVASSVVTSLPPPMIDSAAFTEGANIPERYTCEGEEVSPELTWSAGIGATQSIALLVDDPDAPSRTFSHWLVFDMPPDSTGLAEGAAPGTAGVTGRNDFGSSTYRGPCPPPGSPHRYRFTVYYLDSLIGDNEGLAAGSDRGDFLEAIDGHVIQQATLTGLFGR